MNFSQRVGLKPATKPFQTDSIDRELRVGLWHAFELTVVPELQRHWQYFSSSSRQGLSQLLFFQLWVRVFGAPLDTLPGGGGDALLKVRQWYFQQDRPWNEVYEFIEAVANVGGEFEEVAKAFVSTCNVVLEREFSGYRFIGTTLSPITSDAERDAIVQAVSTDDALLAPVAKHIETALKLVSDRAAPDYRNSMKESISAVEALCKIIAENDRATLGPALDAVTARVSLHAKLQEGFKALYSYSSDTHGIRHALKDDATPEAEDAKFFLVACSGFVNYLVEKARKAGLPQFNRGK